MDTLFTEVEDAAAQVFAPLAVRMRPRTLDELVGQGEACGPGSWLRTAIERDALTSVILFGPAGTGKTAFPPASGTVLPAAGVPDTGAESSGRSSWQQQKEEQARQRKLKNELKKCEDRIHQLEARNEEIDAMLADANIGSDVTKLMTISREKEQNDRELEPLYEQWEKLAEEAEA